MKKFIILLCVPILFIGCKKSNTKSTDHSNNASSFIVRTEYVRAEIIEFKLSDGTKCVGVADKGISCNWK